MLSPFLRTRDHPPRPGRRRSGFMPSPSSLDARSPQFTRSCARHARMMVPPMEAESSVPQLSRVSGDGSSLTSRQPAGWPTITSHPANKPSGHKRKMVDDGLGLQRCELSSHLTVPKRQNQQRKGVQRMKRITCQKGLAIIMPYRRRREAAYILSYQSLLSMSINRASPEMEEQSSCQPGNNPGPWQITLKSNRNESRVCHPSFQKPRSKPTELDSQIHCLTLVDPVIYNPKTDWSQFETTLFFRKTKLKSLHN